MFLHSTNLASTDYCRRFLLGHLLYNLRGRGVETEKFNLEIEKRDPIRLAVSRAGKFEEAVKQARELE